MPIVRYEIAWDIDNHVGFVRIFLNGGGAREFFGLPAADFAAIVALLGTGKAQFNPSAQQIYVQA
ncbi:hypothetical protein V5F49_04590 [Xanthobacter sp. V3C-3]|uniref:hypothetical protein n=1 Tax=Xanthobacter lutulentifluminis TaxID=3119935 RepID=UPI003727095F